LKGAGARQRAFVFADSPQGGKGQEPRDESRGKRFLLRIAKGKSPGLPVIGAAAGTTRLLEAVASGPNLARALLNVLRNKGAPGVDGRSVEEVAVAAPAAGLDPEARGRAARFGDTQRGGPVGSTGGAPNSGTDL